MKTAFVALIMASSSLAGMADEGMWLFNQPPREILRERYQFEPTDAWLDHVQKSSVRFNSGGSGSFVSEDGLLISNHHVGADALQKLSTAEKELLAGRFSRPDARGGAKVPGPGTECAAVDRGRDRAGQCRGSERGGARQRL